MAVQATSVEALDDELGRLLVDRIRVGEQLGVDPFAAVPSAPKRYWDMFLRARAQPARILPAVPDTGSVRSLPTVELKAASRRRGCYDEVHS